MLSNSKKNRCSNNGEFRQLMTNGFPDALTQSDSVRDSLGVLSFASTVTADFFSENESAFSFDGNVVVNYITDAGNDTRRGRSRDLQQQEGRGYGKFESRIELESPLLENDDSSASDGWSSMWMWVLSSFGTTIASMVFA